MTVLIAVAFVVAVLLFALPFAVALRSQHKH